MSQQDVCQTVGQIDGQAFDYWDWVAWQYDQMPWEFQLPGVLYRENAVKLWLEREATQGAYA
jgi:hypothetical protein